MDDEAGSFGEGMDKAVGGRRARLKRRFRIYLYLLTECHTRLGMC